MSMDLQKLSGFSRNPAWLPIAKKVEGRTLIVYPIWEFYGSRRAVRDFFILKLI